MIFGKKVKRNVLIAEMNKPSGSYIKVDKKENECDFDCCQLSCTEEIDLKAPAGFSL